MKATAMRSMPLRDDTINSRTSAGFMISPCPLPRVRSTTLDHAALYLHTGAPQGGGAGHASEAAQGGGRIRGVQAGGQPGTIGEEVPVCFARLAPSPLKQRAAHDDSTSLPPS